jgi:ketosteroid isomerase-like protein
MRKYLTILLIATNLAACNENSINTKTEAEKLMQLSRDWSKSAATDSIEKTISYWAEDAIVMSPGEPALKGKQAIRGMIEGSSKIPGFRISWEPLSVVVSKSGDMAYMIEQNQITVNDSLGNPITQYNKSVTIWRKEADGSWKNVVDMWNAEPARNK